MESKSENPNLKEDEIYMPSPPVDASLFERTLKTYDAERLRKGALQGTIQKFGSRVFCWRIFLGILSADGNASKWAQELHKQRKEYYDRYQEFKITTKNFDPNMFNPLMSSAGSGENPYNFLFKDADLKNTIRQDIERTYQEAQFFRQSYVKDQMMSILFLWSRHNQDISYRQGMNEILGTIFFLFHSEKVKSKIESPDEAAESAQNMLSFMNNEKFLVPDMFVVFNIIMQMGIKELFLPYQQNHKADLESKDKVKSLRKTEELFYFNFDRPSTLQIINDKVARDLSPLMKRCNRIYNFYLKLIDKELYDHLLREKIEPQIHLTRWLRCMLNRQFHIEDVLKFWDAIFSLVSSAFKFDIKKPKDVYAADDYYDKDETDPLVFLDVVCVTMISYVRNYLLDSDTTGCLQRLMKYPPLEDPQQLIKRALEFRRYLFRKEKFPDAVAEGPKGQSVETPRRKQQKEEPASSDPLFQDAPAPKRSDAKKTPLFEDELEPEVQKKEPEPAKKKKATAFGLLNPLAALASGGYEETPLPRSARAEKKTPSVVQKENPIETSQTASTKSSSSMSSGPPRFQSQKSEPRQQKPEQIQSRGPPRFEASSTKSGPPRFQATVTQQKSEPKPQEPQEDQVANPLKPRKNSKQASGFGLLRFEAQPKSEEPSKFYHVMQEEEDGNKKKKGKKEEKKEKKLEPKKEESNSILSLTQNFLQKGKKERELIDSCRLIRTVIRKTKDKESFDPINFTKALAAVDGLQDFVRDNFKE